MVDELTSQLNESFRDAFTPAARYYRHVFVLIIYWEESDDLGFKREAVEIGELFASIFRFTTLAFPIPTTDSYSALKERILHFVRTCGLPGSLLIVYYGGHGDEDDEPEKKRYRKSVWAAYVFTGSSGPNTH